MNKEKDMKEAVDIIFINDTINQAFHPDTCPGEFFVSNPTIDDNEETGEIRLEGNFSCCQCNTVIRNFDNLISHYITKHMQEDWQRLNDEVFDFYKGTYKLKPWKKFDMMITQYLDKIYAIQIIPLDRNAKEKVERKITTIPISRNLSKNKLLGKLEEGLNANEDPDRILISRSNIGRFTISFEYDKENE